MKVLDFPLIKITISFLFGILFSHYCQPSLKVSAVFLGFSTILFCISFFLSIKNKKANNFFGINSCLLSLSVGICVLLFHTDTFDKSNYTHSKIAFEIYPALLSFLLPVLQGCVREVDLKSGSFYHAVVQ